MAQTAQIAQTTQTASKQRQTPGSIRRQERRDRVFAAARDLFQKRGFAATTGEIAERADVAVGTVFRYAASKSELLIMIFNDELERAVARGTRQAAQESDAARAVFAIVEPVVDFAWRNPENSIAYQRELLFGSATDEYRAAGLRQIEDLEASIAELLESRAATGSPASTTEASEAERSSGARKAAAAASAAVFAVTHIAIARMATGTNAGGDRYADLRHQIDTIVAGYYATSSPRTARAHPRGHTAKN